MAGYVYGASTERETRAGVVRAHLARVQARSAAWGLFADPARRAAARELDELEALALAQARMTDEFVPVPSGGARRRFAAQTVTARTVEIAARMVPLVEMLLGDTPGAQAARRHALAAASSTHRRALS